MQNFLDFLISFFLRYSFKVYAYVREGDWGDCHLDHEHGRIRIVMSSRFPTQKVYPASSILTGFAWIVSFRLPSPRRW